MGFTWRPREDMKLSAHRVHVFIRAPTLSNKREWDKFNKAWRRDKNGLEIGLSIALLNAILQFNTLNTHCSSCIPLAQWVNQDTCTCIVIGYILFVAEWALYDIVSGKRNILFFIYLGESHGAKITRVKGLCPTSPPTLIVLWGIWMYRKWYALLWLEWIEGRWFTHHSSSLSN